jgi:uncharacterized protein (UPF0335 family)
VKLQQLKEFVAALAWQHRIDPHELIDAAVARAQEQRTDAQYAEFAERQLGLDDPRHVVVTPEQKKASTRKRLEAEVATARKAVTDAKTAAEQKTAREVLRRLEEALRGLDTEKTAKLADEEDEADRLARITGADPDAVRRSLSAQDKGEKQEQDEDALYAAWMGREGWSA